MRYLFSTLIFICMSVTILCGVRSVRAQEAVPGLSDLVGAKAGQAESTVEQRGYKYVKTDKSGGMSFSYWRESGSNKCVSIKTEDGRYQAIVYTPDFDCQTADGSSAKAAAVSASVDGQCSLYNEKSNNYKYKGNCKIQQTMTDGKNQYDIKLGSGDSYRFVQQGSQYKVQTPEGSSDHLATMTDMGNSATFEWYKWKLTAQQ